MLYILSFLLFSFPRHSSTLQTLIDPVHQWTSFLMPPTSPFLPSTRFHPNQPITSDTCKGVLPWTCLCQPDVSDAVNGPGTATVQSIICKNSRLTDTDTLLTLNSFPNLESAAFYGNNFVELPERILGPAKHKSLLYLNLSSNNLLYLNQDSLVGLAPLQSLDLSDNALLLREASGDWLFLRPLRFLRRLLLRRAFSKVLVNNTAQLILLDRGIRHSRLRDLQFLDLSENEFEFFPPSLICQTPSLTHLILASNRLRTVYFDKRCPVELKALDLRWNRLKYFDYRFITAARNFGAISVQVAENQFDCSSQNCDSINSIKWFQSTRVIKDRETIRCQSSKPRPDEEFKADSYFLYAPVKSNLQCPNRQDTDERIKPTVQTKPPARPDDRPEIELEMEDDDEQALDILVSAGGNDTFANNTANTLATPFYCDTTQRIVRMLPVATVTIVTILMVHSLNISI